MGAFEEVTDPLRRILIRVPPRGPGVCSVCHGAPTPTWALCWTCRENRRQVTEPVRLVVPVSLSTPDSQLHFHLREYKRNREPEVRRESSRFVAALLSRFLLTHGECIRRLAGRSWSAVVVVPSGDGQTGTHPLETALSDSGWGEPVLRPLCRGAGSLDHRRASDDAYRVIENVVGRELLLIDDTMTSGAHLQSAASALALAGADVVAAVPIGRYLDEARGKDAVRQLLARARAAPFDFNICCLEDESPLGI